MSTADVWHAFLFLGLPGTALYVGLLVASMRNGREIVTPNVPQAKPNDSSDRLFCPDTGEPLPLAELPPEGPAYDRQTGTPFVDDRPTAFLARVDESGLVVQPDVAD